MAERRMFAKTIIDSDAFLEMPLSTQSLYFHLAMRADDEGFINNPKKIQRMIGASDDDVKILVAKNFVIPFDSGVVVIKHWRIHNYIRSDRLTKTAYEDERAMLEVKENGSYTVKNDAMSVTCQSTDGQMSVTCQADDSIGKDSIGKYRLVKNSIGKDNISASESHAGSQCESWFTAFWDSYPKKKDKANAVKAFRKVCKTEEDYNTIMSGLLNQIPLWKDPQYIPYPATWLNGKRWEDDLSTDKQKAMSPMQKFLYGGLDER